MRSHPGYPFPDDGSVADNKNDDIVQFIYCNFLSVFASKQ